MFPVANDKITFLLTILCTTQYNITTMSNLEETYNNQILELRRGVIVLAVLSQLEVPMYGYALLTSLEKTGVGVDAGTLYPLLRRLEKQKILDSEWRTDSGRPRRYYVISKLGKELYKKLAQEWSNINSNLTKLLKSK